MLCDEFDPSPTAVISPTDTLKPVPNFPKLCIGVFSHKIVENYLEEHPGEPLTEVRFCSGDIPVYRVKDRDIEFGLFVSLVGAPAASAFLEELGAMGAESFVFFGSCGVLDGKIADSHLIVPTAAVRDEGLSYHYLPPSAEVELAEASVAAARRVMEELEIPYEEGKAWTTDAFYRETRGKVKRRREQGCICVEMECAGLAAVAKFRGYSFGEFFYAADNLDAPAWESRGLSTKGESIGRRCMDAAIEIGKELVKNREK